VGFCLSVGALFLVMSTFFVGCMVAGMVGALVFFQSTIPGFVVRIRRQNAKEVNTRRAVPANGTMPPHEELAESSQYSDEILPQVDGILRSDQEHDKRIEMAALYVRDALHGRFLGEDYLSEGLHKLQYKRWYHALQFARMGNMTVLLGLSFFEVPSWCYFSPQCGDSQHVLMWDLPTLPRETTLMVELLSLAILGFESALKFQYLGKRLYFANKWRIAQMILVLSDATSVVLVAFVSQQGSASPDQSEQFKPIVPSPIIRPLLLLTMSERLRSGFLSLLRVIPRVMDGLLTILVLIVIYAISGMVMFEGTEEGRQYFPDFGSAWLNMLILLTTANFPDVMMPAYEHARYTSIFFITFLMIGLLLMMNLVFASIYQNYRQEVSQRAARFAKRRKKSLEFAFQLLPGKDQDALNENQGKTISRDTLEALIAELLRPVVSFFDTSASPSSEWSKSQVRKTVGKKNELTFAQFVSKIKGFAARQKIKSKKKGQVRHRGSSSNPVVMAGVRFVRSAWFEYFVDVVILGNLVAILFEIQARIDQRIETYTRWEMFMPLFSCFYLVEMALKMYANPWRSYFESLKNRYDCVVTIVIFVAEVSIQVHYTEGMNWQWIRVLLLLRFLRCLRLLVALHSLSTMFSIVLQLLPNFTTLYGAPS
jgi:two pore calcium channel protein, plant